MREQVYLDYAAAAPLDVRVLSAMRPYAGARFGNPSALYAVGVEARSAVEAARSSVAEILHTPPDTVLFTGSGTESCNMAVLGVARNKEQGTRSKRHIVTTAIEHKAVLEPIKKLERDGWKVTYLSVNEQGTVNKEQVVKALRKDTVLVSVMYANNEIGTIQPIAEIGREILKWRKARNSVYPFFHSDACQAAGYLDVTVDRLHVDLLSANGSKIYGPKGIGMLYKRRGVDIEPLLLGGGQEFGLRSGTENVPAIVGFAKALELVNKELGIRNKELTKLRNYFWKEIQKKIPDVTLNGPALDAERLPNNLNVTFHGVDAEALILYLDAAGIQCSSGSACTTDSDEVSHVLLACGIPADAARSSIRFTLGRQTKKEDIAYVLRHLPRIVTQLRKSEKMEHI